MKAFSMLEILITVTILLLIFAIFLLTVDPLGIFADARNRNRESDLEALLNLVYRNMVNNSGEFSCSSGSLPTSTTNLSDNIAATGDYNIAPCLVPEYISSIPYDPSASGAHYTNIISYDLQYSISINPVTNKITMSAPNAEKGADISVAR